MRGLAAIRPVDAPRLRRWDAVVLGGALPGLLTAIRLGQRGARVLVIEETAATRACNGLREPFLLTGDGPAGVLGSCLRELGLPLIDRRRFTPAEIAVQVALPEARVDVGQPAQTLAEWIAWGLVKPEPGRALLETLTEAAQAERESLLAAPIVRSLRRRWRSEGGRATHRPKPPALDPRGEEVPEALRPLLDGLVRALSGLGGNTPSPAARTRLLGGLLTEACVLESEPGGLRDMLRRRITALLGEFRATRGALRLVSIGGAPGVRLEDPPETCAGRVLVLNAPLAGIAAACGAAAPAALLAAPPTRRRISLHFQADASALPEGMGRRVVCVSRPDASAERAVVTLQVFPRRNDGETVDLIASAVGPTDADAREVVEAWIRRTLRNLMPFAKEALGAGTAPEARWDTDALLADPPADRAWPRRAHLRLSQRPPIFALPRDATAGLGFEGDVLLGWRAGDAIADALALD